MKYAILKDALEAQAITDDTDILGIRYGAVYIPLDDKNATHIWAYYNLGYFPPDQAIITVQITPSTGVCKFCNKVFVQARMGKPRMYCSTACKAKGEKNGPCS